MHNRLGCPNNWPYRYNLFRTSTLAAQMADKSCSKLINE